MMKENNGISTYRLDIMEKILVTFIVVTAAISIFLGVCISGCNDKPTDPPPSEPGEHLFYVSARLPGDSSLVKTFSVEQRAFIDSFFVDSFSIYDMAVAGDDEKLFLAGSGMRVYDLKSKQFSYTTTDYCCVVQTSNNSAYYKSVSAGVRVRIFRTADYQEIYYDSNGAASGSFSYDSKYYLYVRFDTVVAYNIWTDYIEHSFGLKRNGSLFRVYKIWPTVDMQKLFVIGNQGWTLYFAAIDLGDDSVRIIDAPLNTWGEDAAVSSDGRYIYFVNTPYTDYEMPRPWVDVYDVSTEQLAERISTEEYSHFQPLRIALTSDGKYLMATPWSMGGVDVLLIDAHNFSVIGRYKFRDQTIPETVCTKQ